LHPQHHILPKPQSLNQEGAAGGGGGGEGMGAEEGEEEEGEGAMAAEFLRDARRWAV